MLVSENQKIGTTLLFLGVLFLCLGVILFSNFLLSIGASVCCGDICIPSTAGNVMFLAGLLLTMGMSRSLRFFRRKIETNAVRGVACFLGGVLLVLVLQRPKLGILIEGFGFVNLFGNFFPIALQAMRQMPYIGSVLSMPGVSGVADKLAGVDPRHSRNWA